MEGWKLSKGTITSRKVSGDEIWSYFISIFSNKSKNQASYKFIFIRSILENLYNIDDEYYLDFNKIYYSFTQISWNLVIINGLTQTDESHKKSAIENVLTRVKSENNIPDDISFDVINDIIKEKIIKEVKAVGKKYVVGAIYGDMEGIIYEFDKKHEYIRFNPKVYKFLQKYQEVIFRLNNYELIKFLEKNNEDKLSYSLTNKVEDITKRSTLEPYKKLLKDLNFNDCFYCGKDLSCGRSKIEADHFIPWSFIHNDQLWNLVLSCRYCNNSKRDKIPSATYLNKLLKRNDNISKITKINKSVIDEMRNYNKDKLIELYKYAQLNGFNNIWTPGN